MQKNKDDFSENMVKLLVGAKWEPGESSKEIYWCYHKNANIKKWKKLSWFNDVNYAFTILISPHLISPRQFIRGTQIYFF